jgi:transcription initiation factor IIF auxiliary subunit
MNIKFNETSEKIDSVNQSQTEVLNTLNSINEKLEYNNQMVIDTIMKVNNSVNKVSKSVKEMRSEIDTLIVYIKK